MFLLFQMLGIQFLKIFVFESSENFAILVLPLKIELKVAKVLKRQNEPMIYAFINNNSFRI